MPWTAERLSALLTELRHRGGDSTQVEVKRAASGLPDNLPQTICAFANMPEGGTLILGVDERRNFEVSGVANPAELEGALISSSRNAVSPPPPIDTTIVDVAGKSVLIADIHGLSIIDKPAKYRQVAYLRQSDGDYQMHDHELRMIEVGKLHVDEQTRYDAREIPGTAVRELDRQLLSQFLRNVREGVGRLRSIDDDDELLRLMSVTTDSGALTLAGSYALGFYPQGADPALNVTAAVQLSRDGTGARTRNLETFAGPLPVLLDDVMSWVRSNISADRVYGSEGHLSVRYEFPMAAVREAIANALVHRDLGPNTLGIGKSVEIRLTDQALIVSSPGGLRGVSVQQLRGRDISRAAVNQRLYEIAKHLRTPDDSRVIEGEGGGIRWILTSTRDADLMAPDFIDSGVQFTVKLWRTPAFNDEDLGYLDSLLPGATLSNLQKRLLVGLRHGEQWSTHRIRQEYSPIDDRQMEAQLQALIDGGLITVTADGIIDSAPAGGSGTGQLSIEAIDSPVPPLPAGRNNPVIYRHLKSDPAGLTVRELSERTGLTTGQVRYALSALRETGYAEISGGAGVRDSRYRALR